MGTAELSPEMLAALICREMKWTWKEYHEAPQRFINTIISLLQAEAKKKKK